MALAFQKKEVKDSESVSHGLLARSLYRLTWTLHIYRGLDFYAIMLTLPGHRLKLLFYIKPMSNSTK